MEPYEVTLDKFTGPLDLLLHLIRRDEISIHDIPIASITEQYLAYLRAMEELSLDVASEFVVMAAWLLAIKSRMLLPRPTNPEMDDMDVQDPREELVNQLLEYERCKWAAEMLADRHETSLFMVSKEPMDLTAFRAGKPIGVVGVTMWDLVDAYRKLVSRIPKEERVAQIKGHVKSVEEMMETLMLQLKQRGAVLFGQLFATIRRRQELVSAFLALLELVKDQKVVCQQTTTFGDIEISLWEEIA